MASSGMGWLTQSTILPKKRREIDIGTASLIDLKAVVFRTEEDVKRAVAGGYFGPSEKRSKKKDKSNKGIAERNAKDMQALREAGQSNADVTAKLKAKARRYERMKRGDFDQDDEKYMVDFEQKYYEGDRRERRYSSDESSRRSDDESSFDSEEDERQRWNAQKDAEEARERKERERQQLRDDEKEFLRSVIQDTKEAREKQMRLKDKRKQAAELRKRRLEERQQRIQKAKAEAEAKALQSKEAEADDTEAVQQPKGISVQELLYIAAQGTLEKEAQGATTTAPGNPDD